MRSNNMFGIANYELILEVIGAREIVDVEGPPITGEPDYYVKSPLLGLYSSWGADLFGRDHVHIGQYLERGMTDSMRTLPRRSRFVGVGSRYIHIGYGCLSAINALDHAATTFDGSTPVMTMEGFLPTQSIRMESTDEFIIHVGLNTFRADVDSGCGSSSSSSSSSSSGDSNKGYFVITSGVVRYEPGLQPPETKFAYGVPYEFLVRGDGVIHAAGSLYVWSDTEVIFSPGAVCFPVTLSVFGGDGGDEFTQPSYTYDVFSADGARQYGLSIGIGSRPYAGPCSPATTGIAMTDIDGNLILLYACESRDAT
jgi:hypothetical protein